MTNAETITRIANLAAELHTRAREQITPGGNTIGDGMPHAGGFGPKAPLDHEMLDLADNLTRTLHGLCEALWKSGVMPRRHLPGLRTRRDLDSFGREVLGNVRDGEGMRHVARYVRNHAPYIAGVPNIEQPLADLEYVVNKALKVFPRESPQWITIEQACKLSGRSARTIKDWRTNKWVDTITDEYGVLYSREGVLAVVESIRQANVERANNARVHT